MKSISEKNKRILKEILGDTAISFAIVLAISALGILFIWSYMHSYKQNLRRVHPDEVQVRDWIESVNGFFYSLYQPERHIVTVCFRNCDITDDDLIRLKQLSRLNRLEIINADITDEAIPTILSLSSLRGLTIENTKITREGVEQIRNERPSLSVEWVGRRNPNDP